MTTETETDTAKILAQLIEAGVTPGAETESISQEAAGEIMHQGGTEMIDGEEVSIPPMVGTGVQGPGYRDVYHTATGSKSRVSINMLPAQLRKRLHETDYPGHDGKLAFTIHDPGFRPTEGTYLCYMHKDSEHRSVCNEFGFSVCVKSNLASPYEQEEHMRKRHPREWGALDRRLERQKEDRASAIQERMAEAMERQAGIAPEVPRPQAPPAPPGPQPPPPAAEVFSKKCRKCGEALTADSKASLNRKMGQHKRHVHPK